MIRNVIHHYATWSTIVAFIAVIFVTQPWTDDRTTEDEFLYDDRQVHSLHVPYSFDHKEALKLRASRLPGWRASHDQAFSCDLSGVDHRNNLRLQEFYDIYDGIWPVLITDVVPQWPAYNWTGEFLNETYGHERVTMKVVNKGLESAVSLAMPLHQFYENAGKAEPEAWTYVEDELFIPMRPELKQDVGQSKYVKEDYFKFFPDEVRPWDAMFLWGSKYSRSSLHMDPYNWTGISAVISGHKRWKLYPPGQDYDLYINDNLRSGFPLDCYKYNSPVDAFDLDEEKYPLYKHAKFIEVDQLRGAMLIIPTGWYHQAYNVEETLAVSGQVMNRNNYRVVLEEILKVGNVPRQNLPHDIDNMSSEQQVEKTMSLLPESLIEHGRAVTENILKQIRDSSVPFEFPTGQGPH